MIHLIQLTQSRTAAAQDLTGATRTGRTNLVFQHATIPRAPCRCEVGGVWPLGP